MFLQCSMIGDPDAVLALGFPNVTTPANRLPPNGSRAVYGLQIERIPAEP